MKEIAIVGCVGVPANYGGFETLAENLAIFHDRQQIASNLTIYCSSKNYKKKPKFFRSARLRYINLRANGPFSVAYDIFCIISATLRGTDTVLLLGVAGAVIIPIVRAFSRTQVVTNLDGVEWKRAKWTGLARWWLRASEALAAKFSNVLIADNEGVANYVRSRYGRECAVIAYGGEHALSPHQLDSSCVPEDLPTDYALALCRIEPENNVEMILSAFSKLPNRSLVFVGNWDNSAYGRSMRNRFNDFKNIALLDPIYELGSLFHIRKRAVAYIHGHSAGGTNPSLVEMMHFERPIFAFDCDFNRFTTENAAFYFNSASEIVTGMDALSEAAREGMAKKMGEIGRRRYTWEIVGRQYFDLLTKRTGS